MQPRRVAQHQGEPLVGRHAAGEPDRQHVGVSTSSTQPSSAALAPRLRHDDLHAAPGVGDELLAHLALRRPHGVGGHLVDRGYQTSAPAMSARAEVLGRAS